jgi:hypothetical protein
MDKKPILEVKRCDEEGKYSWGVYRSDKPSPIMKNISRPHAEHVKKLLKNDPELPEELTPAKDWYDWNVIVDVDENGYGIPPKE